MAAKMPQGLVGVLKGKNFVKPTKKTAAKKELPPALAAAAKRRMSGPPMGPSDNDADDYPMK